MIIRTNVTRKDVSYKGRIIVTQDNYLETLGGPIDVDATYVIDGTVDIGNLEIEVPLTGIRISKEGDEGKLISTEDNYTMFQGTGDIKIDNISITVSGTNSKVFFMSDVDSEYILEHSRVNYSNCTSLGSVSDYLDIKEEYNKYTSYGRVTWYVNNI